MTLHVPAYGAHFVRVLFCLQLFVQVFCACTGLLTHAFFAEAVLLLCVRRLLCLGVCLYVLLSCLLMLFFVLAPAFRVFEPLGNRAVKKKNAGACLLPPWPAFFTEILHPGRLKSDREGRGSFVTITYYTTLYSIL